MAAARSRPAGGSVSGSSLGGDGTPASNPASAHGGGAGTPTSPELHTRPGSVGAAAPLPSPRELVALLDAFVVGQDAAKRVLAVAVHAHNTRVRRLPASASASRDPPASTGGGSLASSGSGSEAGEGGVSPGDATWVPPPMPEACDGSSGLTPDGVATGGADVELDKSNVLLLGPTGSGASHAPLYIALHALCCVSKSSVSFGSLFQARRC